MYTAKWFLLAAGLICTAANSQTRIYDNGAGLDGGRGSPILEIIRESRDLSIEIYEMKDREVLKGLGEAVQSRARVRVLMEPRPLGNGSNDHHDELGRLLGRNFRTFNKENCGRRPGSTNCFQHGKLILSTSRSGERVALISTGNFNSTNLCNLSERPSKCNRDYTVVTKDPKIIALLSEIFEADFKGNRYDLKAIMNRHREAAAQLTISPFSKKPLVDFIAGAAPGCRMQVENQYMKDPELTAAIMSAGAKGVEVEMTLASPCSFGPMQAAQIEDGKVLLASARANRVKIKYFTSEQEVGGKDGYMHAKAIVISGCRDGSADRAWVGSVNGSSMSADHNREFGMFIAEREATNFLKQIMNGDHHDQDSATWLQLTRGNRSCVEKEKTSEV